MKRPKPKHDFLLSIVCVIQKTGGVCCFVLQNCNCCPRKTEKKIFKDMPASRNAHLDESFIVFMIRFVLSLPYFSHEACCNTFNDETMFSNVLLSTTSITVQFPSGLTFSVSVKCETGIVKLLRLWWGRHSITNLFMWKHSQKEGCQRSPWGLSLQNLRPVLTLPPPSKKANLHARQMKTS